MIAVGLDLSGRIANHFGQGCFTKSWEHFYVQGRLGAKLSQYLAGWAPLQKLESEAPQDLCKADLHCTVMAMNQSLEGVSCLDGLDGQR